MKIPSLAASLLCLCSLTAALAIPDTHVIHERQSSHMKSKLRKRSKPDRNLQLPMRIGLKQDNLDKAPAWLMDVAHPASENYGKHWTIDEIIDAFKPSDQTVDAVRQWLRDNGISDRCATLHAVKTPLI